MKQSCQIINNLRKTDYPDPTEILCQMASPAEADMMRILALNHLYNQDIPRQKLLLRFNYSKPWAYYDLLFKEKWDNEQQVQKATEILVKLYEENPFALTGQNGSPYHDDLNKLPVFFKKDGSIINLKGGKLYDLIKVAANLTLDYREIISFEELQEQLWDLNTGDVCVKRAKHIEKNLEVLIIKNHTHFSELNGQRGVFARRNIPKGTVLGYYSGDHSRLNNEMPPMLCSWPISTYRYKLSFLMARHFIQSYMEWTDGYVLGNIMKLVNSACPTACGRRPISPDNAPSYGNTACYFGHFITEEDTKYITLPFYITYKDIKKGEEIMTYYPL